MPAPQETPLTWRKETFRLGYSPERVSFYTGIPTTKLAFLRAIGESPFRYVQRKEKIRYDPKEVHDYVEEKEENK